MLPALGLLTVQQAQGRAPVGGGLAPSVAVLSVWTKSKVWERRTFWTCMSRSQSIMEGKDPSLLACSLLLSGFASFLSQPRITCPENGLVHCGLVPPPRHALPGQSDLSKSFGSAFFSDKLQAVKVTVQVSWTGPLSPAGCALERQQRQTPSQQT